MEESVLYDTSESYGWLMATASQQLRQRLNSKFSDAGYDVTTEQWGVMLHLCEEEGVSQQELAGKYQRSKVAVFKLIGALEKKGFVARFPDPDDGRVKRVVLTPRGREDLAVLVRLAKENLAEASRGVSGENLECFKKVLRQLIDNTRG